MASERWPPIYDEASLKAFIAKLATGAATELYKAFYAGSTERGGPLCQGDVLHRKVGVPVIDEKAQPVTEGTSTYWLVIGNSCDIDRVDERFTQIVPVDELSLSDPKIKVEQPDARAYKYARHFFLPSWAGAAENTMLLADFTRPVALDKAASKKFRVVARMERGAWILLHSCLVRFLARDDGRFDGAPDQH